MSTTSPTVPGTTVSEQVTSLLREHGLRATMPRRTVLAVLVAADREDRHLAVEAIAALLGDDGPDLSTIYRTVASLVELGLLHHTVGDGGAALYRLVDARAADHRHAHLRCRACGAVSDAPGELMGPLRADLATRGFTLDIAHTVLVGICSDCSPEVVD